MKKAERISAFVAQLESTGQSSLNPHYEGYFRCFNARQYYEAHDVLEHLWLRRRDENHAFFKGLIQIAGAFVHLQKQFLRPDHPKDGRRLRPAVRLFHLGVSNLDGYRPRYMRLNTDALCELCGQLAGEISGSDFTRNPWHPAHAPQLVLKTEE